jgi:hypothetical protein
MAYAFYSAFHRDSLQPAGNSDSQHYTHFRRFNEQGGYMARHIDNGDISHMKKYTPFIEQSDFQPEFSLQPPSYVPGPKIEPLEEHYMGDGTVMWTNAKDFIATHREERMPYLGNSIWDHT